MDGASGRVLLSVRGTRSGNDWISEDVKHATAFGGPNFRFPTEWAAVYDIVFGFPGDTHYQHVLPTENDISQAEALEIAKAYIRKSFGISDEEVENYIVDYMFISGWQHNEPEPTEGTIWIVGFYSGEFDEWGYWIPICSVDISSIDGKVISIAMR